MTGMIFIFSHFKLNLQFGQPGRPRSPGVSSSLPGHPQGGHGQSYQQQLQQQQLLEQQQQEFRCVLLHLKLL